MLRVAHAGFCDDRTSTLVPALLAALAFLMILGFYISMIDREQGHERNVPAHIQIPLHTMGLLAQQGHAVHLITNPPRAGRVLPYCMPTDITVHHVIDSRRRKGVLERERGPHEAGGVYPFRAVQQFRQIRRIIREARLDVLHFHGYEQAIFYAGLMRRTRPPCRVVVTHYRPPAEPGYLAARLCRSIDAATTATQYVAANWRSLGPRPCLVPHGLARDLRSEVEGTPEGRHRVLFWRDPSHRNGADIALEVFKRLAPLYPSMTFDLAVRPNPKETPGLDELAKRHDNVRVHRLPYPAGVSLANLMAESVCILLPFRSLTTNPQLAIAESMAAGVPVVTTDIESNPEVIEHNRTGLLVPPDEADAATTAVRRLLDDQELAAAMGTEAAEAARRMWDWSACIDGLTTLYSEICL